MHRRHDFTETRTCSALSVDASNKLPRNSMPDRSYSSMKSSRRIRHFESEFVLMTEAH